MALLFALCAAAALALVFLPIGWQINRFVVWLFYGGRRLGMPDFVTIPWYEFGLNILLFAVPVLLATLLWPRVRWWVWVLLGLFISLSIETIQLLALPREFSLLDLAANTLGAFFAQLVRITPAARHSAAAHDPTITPPRNT